MAYTHPANWTPAPLPATPEGGSEATREVLEHQALLRVAAAAAGASHVEDVLELAAEEALVAVGAASLSVSRYEKAQSEIRTLLNVGDLAPGEVRFPENETYSAGDYALVRDLIENHVPYFNNADDPDCDPLAGRLLRELGKLSDVGVPILVENEVWGEVWATRRPGEPPFTAADADFLAGIAGQFSIAIARAELFSQVSRLAYEDALTGLPNRRAFEERLQRALDRGTRTGAPISLLLCDLDGLKAINDGRGHEAGDGALRNVADTLVRCAARLPGAFVSRLAGDEFCVLMEERPLEEALALGRGVVEDLADGTGESLSCGVATALGGAVDASQLLGDADAALYVAKRRGGARVVSASESWSPVEPAAMAERGDPQTRLLAALDTLAEELDGSRAHGSALDRLEAVAGALTVAGDFAYWAISNVRTGEDLIRDLAVADNRDRRHRGIRVAAGASEYRLSDFPVTERILRAGSGGFVASASEPDPDDAEIVILREMGFKTVIGAAAAGDEATYLVELYGDERTAPVAHFAAALRLAVRAAIPPRPALDGTGVVPDAAA